jgi:ATP-dependent helicase/nuclease subunit B
MQALAADPSASTASAASVEALVDAAIATLGERPDIAALWRRRVLRMAQWVQQRLAEESSWQPAVIEERGRIALAGIGLSGKPDRIDSDGNTLRIIDYKTGSMPKVGKVAALYDTQLALLALLAEAGAFPAVAGQPVGRLEYWHLSGGKEECVVRNALGAKASLDDMRAHMAAAEADLASLVGGYLLGDRPFVAKLHPVYSRARNDFDQLARLVEWLDR